MKSHGICVFLARSIKPQVWRKLPLRGQQVVLQKDRELKLLPSSGAWSHCCLFRFSKTRFSCKSQRLDQPRAFEALRQGESKVLGDLRNCSF